MRELILDLLSNLRKLKFLEAGLEKQKGSR